MTPEERAKLDYKTEMTNAGFVRVECPYMPGTEENSRYYDELRRLQLADHKSVGPSCPGNKQ